MRFIKMHGIANDFLLIDGLAEPGLAARDDLPALARRMSDRHTGVGADGLIILSAPGDPREADLRMSILNSDGSDGGMCGNGLRCAAKFVVDRGYVQPSRAGELVVDCGPRTVRVRVHTEADGLVGRVTVDMGAPEFEPARIPVDVSGLARVELAPGGPQEGPSEYRVGHRDAFFVSVGNPHMVSFIAEPVWEVDLEREGPGFERHPIFPQRVNYHVVNTISRREATVRTWERGAGMTLGCGTGACATVAAGAASGRLDRRVLVHMPGGDLEIEWDRGTGRLLKTGPAVEVYHGDWRG